ncbi:hypothetical protein EGR_09590 [Echinococcus granulosus]|uniref:Uncharacterized protein n=1 Tax=Echinococcus granulosus TaxID=6210 RepID=W6U371_ECHGR|nr:hypothetical protein EGR_09590 [Echinococcus granulosus]EUB55553.1 hypothetical protein EGR_09590 [Echinococcus granulosus]
MIQHEVLAVNQMEKLYLKTIDVYNPVMLRIFKSVQLQKPKSHRTPDGTKAKDQAAMLSLLIFKTDLPLTSFEELSQMSKNEQFCFFAPDN